MVYIWLKAFEDVLVFSFLTLSPSPNIPRTPGSSESRKLFSNVGHVEDVDGLELVASRLRTLGGCGNEAILTERRTSAPG